MGVEPAASVIEIQESMALCNCSTGSACGRLTGRGCSSNGIGGSDQRSAGLYGSRTAASFCEATTIPNVIDGANVLGNSFAVCGDSRYTAVGSSEMGIDSCEQLQRHGVH